MEYRSIREARSSLARREAQIQQAQRDMATREQQSRRLKRVGKLLQ